MPLLQRAGRDTTTRSPDPFSYEAQLRSRSAPHWRPSPPRGEIELGSHWRVIAAPAEAPRAKRQSREVPMPRGPAGEGQGCTAAAGGPARCARKLFSHPQSALQAGFRQRECIVDPSDHDQTRSDRGQGSDEDTIIIDGLHGIHAQLDRFGVLTEEGMKVSPMALDQQPRCEIDGGAFDVSHESRGFLNSAQTASHRERQGIGQTFPSIVVGLVPDEGGQKLSCLLEAVPGAEATIRAQAGPRTCFSVRAKQRQASRRGRGPPTGWPPVPIRRGRRDPPFHPTLATAPPA